MTLERRLSTVLAEVSRVIGAVAAGDLSQQVTLEHDRARLGGELRRELGQLEDNLNDMLASLRVTTQRTTEQAWLKTNLAKFTRMLQGQRDLVTVAQQILSELAPLVSAQHGAFYLAEPDPGGEPVLTMLASYALADAEQRGQRWRLGEGLVGQCAFERRTILVTSVPPDYLRIGSGLGDAPARSIVVLPVLFEGQVNAVIELATFDRFSEIHQAFLEELTESIGIVVNTIAASMRTEALLQQSQSLTERLRQQQDELQRTNDELALTSRYKSEFLANMSHELRTPLNSLLILSKVLAENGERNLTERQVEFAGAIHASGTDLLSLINDILDLSKVESGTLSIDAVAIGVDQVRDHVAQGFRHVAALKQLRFAAEIRPGTPSRMVTDPKRLLQILKNLIANAFKFTERGAVTLSIGTAEHGWSRGHAALDRADQVIAFTVADSGIGIPADKQRIIFEAFQQADGTTSRKYGGTGLGLSISRELAGLLGGEIRVASVPGQGSEFTLYLPHVHRTARAQTPTDPGLRAIDQPAGELEDEPLDPRMPPDDADRIAPGDRVIVIVADQPEPAARLMAAVRQRGLRAVIAPRGELGLRLVARLAPAAVVIDVELADGDGWAVLDQLKHDPAVAHLPVVVIAGAEARARAERMGARSSLPRGASALELAAAIADAAELAARTVRRLLLIDPDDGERDRLVDWLGGEDVAITAVACGDVAVTALRDQRFDAVVVDPLRDPETAQRLAELGAAVATMPAVIHAGGRDRLLADTVRHLHRRHSDLTPAQRHALDELRRHDPILAGTRVLIIDDDVRNIFAVTSVLESQQVEVTCADSGADGLRALDRDAGFNAVLMDIMMPEMDGYEVMRRVREMPWCRELPIIAVTAKAMRADRARCLEAGATDHLAKPIDAGRLLSLLRVRVGS